MHVELFPKPRSTARLARLKGVRGHWEHFAGAIQLEAEDYVILRELYASEVSMVDALLGRLIEQLAALGRLDDTLVIVTSDHGENIGEHGRIDHARSMYETTIRVPLVLRYPSRVAAGTVDERIASLTDVFSTIEDAVGIANEEASARSLLATDRIVREFVIAEGERPTHGIELLEQHFPDAAASLIDERLRMLRTKRHKIIWHEKGDHELYDLEQDPDELRDISAESPALRSQLLEKLERWMREHEDDRSGGLLTSPDAESRRQLRALGYAE